MSISLPTAIARRRPACGARNFMTPIFRVVLGAVHHRVFRKLNGHRLAASAICEDLPEEHNRVTLDPVLKDSHGIPAPRVDYTISENSEKMIQHGVARAKEILTAAGATDIC